jgi:hypothetical protein
MEKHKELNINQMILRAHKRAVKMAIDLAARTNTPLIISENGKVKAIKPPYRYVRRWNKTTSKNKSRG